MPRASAGLQRPAKSVIGRSELRDIAEAKGDVGAERERGRKARQVFPGEDSNPQ
jgi:hypothetical protein